MGQTSYAIAASGDDARVYKQSATYPPTGSVIRETTAATAGAARYNNGSSTDFFIMNGLYRWNTSDLASLTIPSAYLQIVGNGANDNPDSRQLTLDWYLFDGTDADYSETALTNAHAGTLIGTIGVGSLYQIPLLNPNANINKTGMTGLRAHVSGGLPTGANRCYFESFDAAVPANYPTLIVNWTTTTTRLAPDAILSMTNLSGAVTDIDEDPDTGDASWLTVT